MDVIDAEPRQRTFDVAGPGLPWFGGYPTLNAVSEGIPRGTAHYGGEEARQDRL